MRTLPILLAPVVLALACTHSLIAADNGKGPAFAEPPKGDPDFVLMGEFVGEIMPEEGKKEQLGLAIEGTRRRVLRCSVVSGWSARTGQAQARGLSNDRSAIGRLCGSFGRPLGHDCGERALSVG